MYRSYFYSMSVNNVDINCNTEQFKSNFQVN